MNNLNFCWFSVQPCHSVHHDKLPKVLHPSALPKSEYLNNLMRWSRHLLKTEFLPILWVNQAGDDELTDSDRKHHIIKNPIEIEKALPENWKKSYADLVRKVGSENVMFWRSMHRNAVYSDKLYNDINVMVVNLEGFFKSLSITLPVFNRVTNILHELLAARVFAFIKDSTVEFILSIIGGFYFDLDLAPILKQPFFNSMDDLKREIEKHPTSKRLLKYGDILTILKSDKYNPDQIELDVGMKVSIGDIVELTPGHYHGCPIEISREAKEEFWEQIKECRNIIKRSPQQMLMNLNIQEKIKYFNLYEKDRNELVETLYSLPRDSFLEKIVKVKLYLQYRDILRSVLKKEHVCIHDHEEDTVFNDWLKNDYAPFYKNNFSNKFHQIDANEPSRYFYLGYHLIEEQVKAGKILSYYFKRLLKNKEPKKEYIPINIQARPAQLYLDPRRRVRLFSHLPSTAV